MANEKRLIDELREMADRTPPICQYDRPYNTEILGKKITVYCKPFEQFQELLRRAADALSVDAVEVVHGEWDVITDDCTFDVIYQCSVCKEEFVTNDGTPAENLWHYCPNCGAKMDGGNDDGKML
jgi:DNA-directed RNA polymerase subunit RPC12/RpoP